MISTRHQAYFLCSRHFGTDSGGKRRCFEISYTGWRNSVQAGDAMFRAFNRWPDQPHR